LNTAGGDATRKSPGCKLAAATAGACHTRAHCALQTARAATLLQQG
jgi:hypothetical protein